MINTPTWTLDVWEDHNGRSPFEKWYEKLDTAHPACNKRCQQVWAVQRGPAGPWLDDLEYQGGAGGRRLLVSELVVIDRALDGLMFYLATLCQ